MEEEDEHLSILKQRRETKTLADKWEDRFSKSAQCIRDRVHTLFQRPVFYRMAYIPFDDEPQVLLRRFDRHYRFCLSSIYDLEYADPQRMWRHHNLELIDKVNDYVIYLLQMEKEIRALPESAWYVYEIECARSIYKEDMGTEKFEVALATIDQYTDLTPSIVNIIEDYIWPFLPERDVGGGERKRRKTEDCNPVK